MAHIYETKHFVVSSADEPLIDRIDGGHILISPKKPLLDRTEMTDEQALEFMKLTMLIGKAIEVGMTSRGIEIMRINYQDMGNWAFKRNASPHFHLHIFGRSKNSINQPYMESVKLPDKSTGFYNGLAQLEELDILEINKQITNLLEEEQSNRSSKNLKISNVA